jgi:hypothetical protein
MNKIFISHSSSDKEAARDLAEALKEQGVEYWLDEQNLSFGSDITSKINEGISNSSGVVFLLSESSNEKSWLSSEVALALSKNKRVFPIILTENAKVPLLLRAYKYIVATSKDNLVRAAKEIANIVSLGNSIDSDEYKNYKLRLESALAQKELIEKEKELSAQLRELKEIEFKKKGIFTTIFSITAAICVGFLTILLDSENSKFNYFSAYVWLILGFVSSEILHIYKKSKSDKESRKEVQR